MSARGQRATVTLGSWQPRRLPLHPVTVQQESLGSSQQIPLILNRRHHDQPCSMPLSEKLCKAAMPHSTTRAAG